MQNTSEPYRAPRAVFSPDARLTAGTAVLAVAAVFATVFTTDRTGAVLFCLAAVFLLAYTATDLVWRPRLVADTSGLVVRGPGSSARLSWAEVDAVRADVRMRHGLRSAALEIDAGERLIVLSRRALGTDPEHAADLVRSFAPSR